jgi:uncharacterized protein (TIGR03437 family)
MPVVRVAILVVLLVPFALAVPPVYTAASVVNTATGFADAFAPNSMVTVYGTTLAYGTQAASPGQAALPRILAGVQVIVNGGAADLYYVSPQQINFLIPSILTPGPVKLYIAREGVAGPVLTLNLNETAPGFFPQDTGAVIATHSNGQLLSSDSPAIPNEVVVIYAAGLGRTDPEEDPGHASLRAAPILLLSKLIVLLGSRPVDAGRVLYAGITPGFAGLYQINLRLPADVGEDPEIRVFVGAQGSPSFLKLPVRLQ